MSELLEELKIRLTKVGGTIFSEMTNGDEVGSIGVNAKGATKVYFALYPDGTMQRFERQITASDLKTGWTTNQLAEPITAPSKTVVVSKPLTETAVSEAPVKKRKKKGDRVWTTEEQIYLSDLEFKAVTGIRGDLETVIIDKHFVKKVERQGQTLKVAHAEYTATVRNKSFMGMMSQDVDRSGNKRLETFRVLIWRSVDRPEQLICKPL